MAGKKKYSSWMGDDGPGVDDGDGGGDDASDSEWVDQQTVTVTGPQEEAPEDYTTVEDIQLAPRRHWLHRLFVPQDTVDYTGGYNPRYPGGYRPGAPPGQRQFSPYRPGAPGRPGVPRPPSSYRPPVTGRPASPGGVRPQAPRAGVRPPAPHQGASRTTIQGEDDLDGGCEVHEDVHEVR
jgi:hypothetical protein